MSPVTLVVISLAGGIVVGKVVDLPFAGTSGVAISVFLAAPLIMWCGRRLGSSTPVPWLPAALCLGFFALGLTLISLDSGESGGPAGWYREERTPNPVYERFARRVEDALPPGEAAQFLAIVFGDQTKVGPSIKEDFRRAGLLHVFAASGFNVTLAAAFMMFAAAKLRAPRRVAGAMALFSIAGYFWLVGPSPSVTRATLMAVILYATLFAGRRADTLAATAAAGAAMLLVAPGSLFDIGWQLSFSSLLGILFFYPKLASRVAPAAEVAAAPFLITAAAQLGVTPVLLYHFGQVSMVAVLANPMATAAVAVITSIGLGSLLVSFVSPTLAGLLMQSTRPLLALVRLAAEFFGSWPGAVVQVEPSLGPAAFFIAAVAFTWVLFHRRVRQLTLPIFILVGLGLPIAGIWYGLAAGVPRAAMMVDFLDIGQGDATLIRAEGWKVLVDGGSDWRLLDRELRGRGVRRLDLLILSHPHADHLGAFDELVGDMPVGLILESGFPSRTRAYRRFREAAKARNVRVERARGGETYTVGPLRLDILWPRRTFIRDTGSDINNNSLVVKVRYEEFTVLLPGDVEDAALDRLAAGGIDLSADILKVSHQGADNGTTTAFLRRVRPRYAIISVGEGNPYGHPHRGALARLRRNVPILARTDLDGDISFTSDGRRIDFMR